MQKPAICKTGGISKRFGPVQALKDVSICVNEGETLGIVGENGAGKSTLLKVLCALHPQDAGWIEFMGERVNFRNYHEATLAGISMVFQEQALIQNMPVYENLLFGHEERFTKFGFLSRGKMINAARESLGAFGLGDIDVTRATSSYDYHTRQMIEITRAFAISQLLGVKKPLLLLDEPTEGLTDPEVESLFAHMERARKWATLIFVSHRLSEVLTICDRIYVFKDGQAVTDMPAQNVTVDSLHELMVGRQRDTLFYLEDEQLTPEEEVVLKIRGLRKKGFFKGVDLDLHRGEILGIGGVLGSGKEKLADALVGATEIDEGSVELEGKPLKMGSPARCVSMGIGLVPKERALEGIIPQLSICWNTTLPSIRGSLSNNYGVLRLKEEKKIAKEYKERLRVAAPSIWTKIGNLSGGNQQKVVVAKWLAANLKALVLNNPTRGVDVGAKHELYKIFRMAVKEGIPIILISDELLELIGLSNRIVIMRDKEVSGEVMALADSKPTEAQLVKNMV